MSTSDRKDSSTPADDCTNAASELKRAERDQVIAMLRLASAIEESAAPDCDAGQPKASPRGARDAPGRRELAGQLARAVPGMSRSYARRILDLRALARRCHGLGLTLGEIELDSQRVLFALASAARRNLDRRLPQLVCDAKRQRLEEFRRRHSCPPRPAGDGPGYRKHGSRTLEWILRWMGDAEAQELGKVAAAATRIARSAAAGHLIRAARARFPDMMLREEARA